nr:MAG TPA: terminase large subunit [Caudoviricetes sp.]
MMRSRNGARVNYPDWMLGSLKTLKPPEKMTVSQWADKYRIIPAGTSNQPGRWKTSKTPYLRGIMDAFSDDRIEEIVFIKPTQVGGTESILNILGYIVDQDPSSTLVVYPSDTLAEDISKNRIQPMLRATKPLAEKFREDDSKLLALQFDNMYIPLTGANSAASLSSKPIRFVLLDEVDKYPPRSGGGKEADPISLARERTNTFSYNKKIFITSTPTLKTGAIWREWESCTRQLFFYVPCPHCGRMQRLRFHQLKFPKEGSKTERSAAAYYECPYCQGKISDADKNKILQLGQWMNEGETEGMRVSPKKTGFALNAIYSPWLSFADVAYKWLDAQGDQEKMQNFVNSWLGEPWEDVGSTAGAQKVLDNRGVYTRGMVPDWAQIITCGVDVQQNCLYYTVDAWGQGKKIYNIDHDCIPGVDFNTLWDVINQTYYDAKGRDWYIDLALIDSGDQTDQVYDFCYVHNPLTVPVKGSSTPIPARYRVSAIQREGSAARGMNLIICDGSYYKTMIYAKINAVDGSWQVFDGVDQEYCEQITNEHKVFERKNGVGSWVWRPKTSGAPNHYLDCEVYAACAADLLGAFALLEDPPEPAAEESTYQREEEDENWFGDNEDDDWGDDWL